MLPSPPKTRFELAARCLVVVAGVAAAFLGAACATRGIVPRIMSESVIVRGADHPSNRPAGAPVNATQSLRKTGAKAKSVAGASPRVEGQAVGTRGFGDAEAEAAVALPPAAGQFSSLPATPSKPASAPKRTATRLASVAGGGWLFALALVGAVACTVFYRRRLS